MAMLQHIIICNYPAQLHEVKLIIIVQSNDNHEKVDTFSLNKI